ncbi:hypothetical protein RHGRI_017075 [Rhododendron griersonianum]|uniref:Uncharacterized protein n=1 Tax=Rhododendron griersonianum TaxID=479676 RepID=A0AAV6JWK0_9ERIC|nr:hypothetical protein RHGRI_017075 [Rhododendron griersonianum]
MEPPESVQITFELAENIILRWDTISSEQPRDRTIIDGNDCHEIHQYLNAIDEIQLSLESALLIESDHHTKAKTAIWIAMAQLEDRFRNLLTSHTSPIETDCLFNPNSSLKKHSI